MNSAVAHFHHAHAAALPVEHFIGCLPQNFFWHGGGAGGEIEHAHLEIPEIRFADADERRIKRRPRSHVQKEMAVCASCANSHYRTVLKTRQ
jgi:hypothetical protein